MKRGFAVWVVCTAATIASAQETPLARDLRAVIAAAPAFSTLQAESSPTPMTSSYRSSLVIDGLTGAQIERGSGHARYTAFRLEAARYAQSTYEDLARRLPAAIPAGWSRCEPHLRGFPANADVRRIAFVDSLRLPRLAITLTLSERAERRLVQLAVTPLSRPELSPCE